MSKSGICFLLFLMLDIAPISDVLHAQQTDARQIAQKVYEQAAFQSLEMRASLTVYDREGHSIKKEFLYRRVNTNQGSKTRVDMIAPQEEKGVVLLALRQHGLPLGRYIYVPAIDRVRSLGPEDRDGKFLGSDFTFDDFADRNPADYHYRLLGDSEKIDGQETYKIESRPISPGNSPYAYVYLWVSKKAPVIIFAQMYSAQGSLMRALHATDLRHESGLWGARHTEMSTAAEHTRTVLTVQNVKLNQQIEDAVFSPQSLGPTVSRGKK